MQKGLGLGLEWRSDSVVFRYWLIRSGERIGQGAKRLGTIKNTGQYGQTRPDLSAKKKAKAGLLYLPKATEAY